MLPLDSCPESVLALLGAYGAHPDAMDVCLHFDLDCAGNFGEVWLLLSSTEGMLYRVSDSVEAFPLAILTEPYIDNYTTSNRLQVHRHREDDLPPVMEEGEDPEAFRQRQRAYDCSGETMVLGYCTNACKKKLSAFLNLWDRLGRGETVGADDALFDQFNMTCPKCGRPYDDQERKICSHCVNKKGVFRRLLQYFTKFRLQLAAVLLLLLGSTLISLVSPIVSGQLLFDQVISEPSYNDAGKQITGTMHEEKYVYLFVGILIGLAVLNLLIGVLRNRINAYMSTRVVKNIKNEVFIAMQRLSLSYFNKNPTGRLINRVNYDAERIRSFFIDGLPYFLVHVLQFIGLAVILFTINWKLTLLLFIPIPLIVCIIKFRLPKLWRSYSKLWRRSSSMNSMMNDSLSGIRVVKAFAKETDETAQFLHYSTKLYDASLHTNMIALSIFPVVSIIIGVFCHAMWGIGGIVVIGKEMTYGQLTAYIGYTGMIFGPLSFFTNFTDLVTDTMNSAVRIFEVIDAVPDITDAPDAVSMPEIKGEIGFNHVCFHYNPNRPILKDVTFTIHQGDHVGLVGHTGSGKSTIANLITRMYDVVSGFVTLDGVDIKEIKQADIHRNIAIVSQEIFIFRGTIADNIRYARPEASMEEVIAAAKSANAHDFIMRLPEGYESNVGIGNRSLSGGERQRIAIARALLLNPSILILDEATAAMDTETECQISNAIDKLIVGHTTISIAHRLSTLKNCNYLMSIDNGELAEMGTAEELLARKGIYYKLWTLQTEQMQKVMEGN